MEGGGGEKSWTSCDGLSGRAVIMVMRVELMMTS